MLAFKFDGKRYRIASGHVLGRPDLVPNSLPYPKSEILWDELKALLVKELKQGINPLSKEKCIKRTEQKLTVSSEGTTVQIPVKIKGRIQDLDRIIIEISG